MPLNNQSMINRMEDVNFMTIEEVDLENGNLIFEYYDKIYAIKKDFNIDGYVHKQTSRCTILSEEIDCQTFQLSKDLDKIEILYQPKHNMRDAMLIDDYSKGGGLKLISQLNPCQDTMNDYRFSMVDLD